MMDSGTVSVCLGGIEKKQQSPVDNLDSLEI